MDQAMSFDWRFPYASQRMPVLARNVVATSQPLASQAGLEMLAKGGNAVDAALAAAICLTVVEPTSNGLGGDAFALVWDGRELHGFNGSGRSPAEMRLERFSGRQSMPDLGWESVTVPGAVDAWSRLSKRFGALPFQALFGPAMGYAREGFQVSPMTASTWSSLVPRYADFPSWRAMFCPRGRAPRAGELFACPDQADSLKAIGESHGESFYRGDLARSIADKSEREGGLLRYEDLAEHAGEWVSPIGTDYRGARLLEVPPNGQGLAALIALGILERLDLSDMPGIDSAESIHLQVEAMKLAFVEVFGHVADPLAMRCSPECFLQAGYLDNLAGRIDPERAAGPGPVPARSGGTVYLSAADAQGMMVSFIQSNYTGFGSGVVVEGTGISLQNRGAGFVLEPGHPNVVAERKRPFHTIIPGFVTVDGRPAMSIGVMGGHMQPQGHVQMLVRIHGYRQNPQAALDAPRWHLGPDLALSLEPGFPPGIAESLQHKGHVMDLDPAPSLFGGGQIVHCLEKGYLAASDPRKDGQAVGF